MSRPVSTRARAYTLPQRLAMSRFARARATAAAIERDALRVEAAKRLSYSLQRKGLPAVRIGARPAPHPLKRHYPMIRPMPVQPPPVVRKGPYPVDEVPPADAGVTPTPAEELAFMEEENMIMEYLPWIVAGSAVVLLLVLRR